MKKATVVINPARNRHPINRHIFGSFLEHMGRAVYEGVYQPEHPTADGAGCRQDVSQAVREMGVSTIRYPGGNYVSFADWKDGVGPKDQRPTRPDFAWKSLESNQFGTEEFLNWCRSVNADPMLAVNLGTGTPKEACELVEFTNLKRGSYWADKRAQKEPYGVKTWCLGNEMDGPWQAGQVPANEYALKARAASRLMKGLDPTIKTVLSGSSGCGMSTYMEWDATILDICWDDVDMIASHQYSNNHPNDTRWFLGEGRFIERIIDDYRALVHVVGKRKRSSKAIKLSFDEWNVWYKAMNMDGGWQHAPHLIEEVYNLEDALVCATILNAFIRNADFVDTACLAQIVNIIGPILTTREDMVKQTIYYPFALMSKMAQGADTCDSWTDVETYDAGDRKSIPVLDVSVALIGQEVRATLVNLSLDEPMEVTVRATSGNVAKSAHVFSGPDPKQANTFEDPNAMLPKPLEAERTGEDAVRVILPPMSFAVLGG